MLSVIVLSLTTILTSTICAIVPCNFCQEIYLRGVPACLCPGRDPVLLQVWMMLISMILDLGGFTSDVEFFGVERTDQRTDEQADSRSWIKEVFPRVSVQGGVPFYCGHVHIRAANIDTIHAHSTGKYFTAHCATIWTFLFRYSVHQQMHWHQSSELKSPNQTHGTKIIIHSLWCTLHTIFWNYPLAAHAFLIMYLSIRISVSSRLECFVNFPRYKYHVCAQCSLLCKCRATKGRGLKVCVTPNAFLDM